MAKGEFSSNDVHKQYGISLRTPAYADQSIAEPVLCSMYLYRPKNKTRSDPVDFTFYPPESANRATAQAVETPKVSVVRPYPNRPRQPASR